MKCRALLDEQPRQSWKFSWASIEDGSGFELPFLFSLSFSSFILLVDSNPSIFASSVVLPGLPSKSVLYVKLSVYSPGLSVERSY